MSRLIPFSFENHEIRTLIIDDQPWFVASDVCAALGYKNPSKAVADHLDADERRYNETLDRGGNRLLVNESGLYALVLRSHKPEARKFAKWVTAEVLPSIRKTGSYSANQQLSAPTPILCSLPGPGRYLVIADQDGTRIHSAAGKVLLDYELHSKLRRDTRTLVATMLEWASRARIVGGEASPKELEQPLQISFREAI